MEWVWHPTHGFRCDELWGCLATFGLGKLDRELFKGAPNIRKALSPWKIGQAKEVNANISFVILLFALLYIHPPDLGL